MEKQINYLENPEMLAKFKPVVIDNVFTQLEIDQIYAAFDKNEKPLEPEFGRTSYLIKRNKIEGVFKTVENLMIKTFNQKMLCNEDPFIIRYNTEYGYQTKLAPHFDRRDYHKAVFDVQLNYNEDWAIVIGEETFNLKFNQGLLFIGTDQLHWREEKTLKAGSEIDLLIWNIDFWPRIPSGEDHYKKMIQDEYYLLQDVKIGVGPEELKS
jgi:hypothetical protein